MFVIVRRGQRGALVEKLQRRLENAGFRPGSIDGVFGPATEAALLAFQKSRGLIADGVAGPRVWSVLNAKSDIQSFDATGSVTVDLVAQMFPSTAFGPINRNLPAILTALRQIGATDKPLVLSALATVRAESEGFEPIDERPSRFNTSPQGHPFDLYDHRADLGNIGTPDGERFKGRGFVQLTGRHNYSRFGKAIGLGHGLVDQPERANQPRFAARILATFIQSRAGSIKQAVLSNDLGRVRRLVNGGGHGLHRFVDAYRIGDRLLDDPVWNTLPAA